MLLYAKCSLPSGGCMLDQQVAFEMQGDLAKNIGPIHSKCKELMVLLTEGA